MESLLYFGDRGQSIMLSSIFRKVYEWTSLWPARSVDAGIMMVQLMTQHWCLSFKNKIDMHVYVEHQALFWSKLTPSLKPWCYEIIYIHHSYMAIFLCSDEVITCRAWRQLRLHGIFMEYMGIQGLYSLKRCHIMGIGIPIVNLRWSPDHLRFTMGIPIPID